MPRMSKRQKLNDAALKGDGKAGWELFQLAKQEERAKQQRQWLNFVIAMPNAVLAAKVQDLMARSEKYDARQVIAFSVSNKTAALLDGLCAASGLNRGRLLDYLMPAFAPIPEALEILESIPGLRALLPNVGDAGDLELDADFKAGIEKWREKMRAEGRDKRGR